ncbi:SRPBCC domain-containing protein [bacterium]|nr:SRPBCC domain-containing protein [bacterium]
MHHEITTSIDIAASPETVWSILTDLERFSEWNPFVVESSGTVAVGEKLVNRLQPPGGKAMTFKPKVTAVEPGKVFEWLGRLGLPGLFDGRHRFEIERTDTGSRFIHSESFKGILVRVFKRSLDASTVEGFNLMNAALKERAETAA